MLVLEEDTATLDSAASSLEIAPELLSIESGPVAVLELSLSPHAEIKTPVISAIQELRMVLPEKIFINSSFRNSRDVTKLVM